MAESMSPDEIMNKIRNYKITIRKLIRERGENNDEVEFQKAMLDGLEEQLEELGAPQRAAESNEQIKQREIELEIIEHEDRIGRACSVCEELKQKFENYKAEVGVAASSPERNARIQAARAEKAMRNEENAKRERELDEAVAKQALEHDAEVAKIVAKLEAVPVPVPAPVPAPAPAVKKWSLFGKGGGNRKTKRRNVKSKKTRRNHRY
jgi:chromosome segregation ATPase